MAGFDLHDAYGKGLAHGMVAGVLIAAAAGVIGVLASVLSP